jgi:hypothetical protein
MDVSTVDTQLLEVGIVTAKKLGVKSAAAAKLLHTAEIVHPLRLALQQLDWEQISEIVEGIDMQSLSAVAVEEIETIQDECANRVIVAEITFALKQGTEEASSPGKRGVLRPNSVSGRASILSLSSLPDSGSGTSGGGVFHLEALDAALAHARKLRQQSGGANAILHMSDMMRELQVGLAASDWTKVHEVVAEALAKEEQLGLFTHAAVFDKATGLNIVASCYL